MEKIFSFVAIVTIVFAASCTQAFKKKMEVAQTLTSYLNATGVNVGYETKTGGKSETKLTFSGITPAGYDEEDYYMISNLVAWKFVHAMTPQELNGETHVAIVAQLTDGTNYLFEFPMADLNDDDELLAITNNAANACMKHDRKKLHSLSAPDQLPDTGISVICNYAVQNVRFSKAPHATSN